MVIPFPPSNAGKNGRALELPLYQLMYDGDEPPEVPTAITSNGDGPQMRAFGARGTLLAEVGKASGEDEPDDQRPRAPL